MVILAGWGVNGRVDVSKPSAAVNVATVMPNERDYPADDRRLTYITAKTGPPGIPGPAQWA